MQTLQARRDIRTSKHLLLTAAARTDTHPHLSPAQPLQTRIQPSKDVCEGGRGSDETCHHAHLVESLLCGIREEGEEWRANRSISSCHTDFFQELIRDMSLDEINATLGLLETREPMAVEASPAAAALHGFGGREGGGASLRLIARAAHLIIGLRDNDVVEGVSPSLSAGSHEMPAKLNSRSALRVGGPGLPGVARMHIDGAIESLVFAAACQRSYVSLSLPNNGGGESGRQGGGSCKGEQVVLSVIDGEGFIEASCALGLLTASCSTSCLREDQSTCAPALRSLARSLAATCVGAHGQAASPNGAHTDAATVRTDLGGWGAAQGEGSVKAVDGGVRERYGGMGAEEISLEVAQQKVCASYTCEHTRCPALFDKCVLV